MAAAAGAGHSDSARDCRLWLCGGGAVSHYPGNALVFQAGANARRCTATLSVRTNRSAAFRRRPAVRLVMRSTGSDEGTWVLFLHGNAATIASQVNIAHYSELRNLGVNVLARSITALPGSAARRPRRCSHPMRARRTTTSGGTPGRPVAHRDLRLVAGIRVAVGLASEV